MLEISATLVPLITPFTDDMSAVSEVRLARLVRRLVSQGAAGFVVCSDTGEFGTLSHSERKMILEVVMRESQNALPVLVNATTLGTMTALDLAQHAGRHGARAAIVTPPFYGRYTIEEVQHHMKTIANYANLPILLCAQPDLHPDELFDKVLEHRGIYKVQALEEAKAPGLRVSPYPTTDEFSAYDFCVSPMGLLDANCLHLNGQAATPQQKRMAQAFRKYGVTRVVKTLWNDDEFEIGPPRTPMQPIERKELEAFLQVEAA